MSSRRALRCAWLLMVTLAASRSGTAVADEAATYQVEYYARIIATERAARVTVTVRDPDHLLREVRWRIDPERHREISADGTLETRDDVVDWTPQGGESTFSYVFRIDQLRDERSYEARCSESYAIFRGDDLIPPARVRTLKGARAQAKLQLKLPEGWSSVAPYPPAGDDGFLVERANRRFVRPVGWILVGDLGVLREKVAGSRVAVAGPTGQRLHRLDVLALLRWTLPSLREMVGDLPERMLVVMAGDPMWRGGLSGPSSVFVHASRPLISEDGTSPVLHELVHSALGLEPGPGGDWIIEGLAELYSMEALVRSKTISRKRHSKAVKRLAERGREAPQLEVEAASGAVTGRGVTVLYALDKELRSRTEEAHSLEEVVRLLVEADAHVTTALLKSTAEQLTGLDLSPFFSRWVGEPG